MVLKTIPGALSGAEARSDGGRRGASLPSPLSVSRSRVRPYGLSSGCAAEVTGLEATGLVTGR